MFQLDDDVMYIENMDDKVYTSTHRYTLFGLIINLLLSLIWIAILNYICSFKYGDRIAWIIVLLPIIFMIICLIIILALFGYFTFKLTNISNKIKNNNNNNDNNDNNDNNVGSRVVGGEGPLSLKNKKNDILLVDGNNPLMNGNNMMANGNVMSMDVTNKGMSLYL